MRCSENFVVSDAMCAWTIARYSLASDSGTTGTIGATKGALSVSAATSLTNAFGAYAKQFTAADAKLTFAASGDLADKIRAGARPGGHSPRSLTPGRVRSTPRVETSERGSNQLCVQGDIGLEHFGDWGVLLRVLRQPGMWRDPDLVPGSDPRGGSDLTLETFTHL